MKKIILSLVLLTALPGLLSASKNFSDLKEKAEYYHNRYSPESVNTQITDNFGNDFDDLYGTRNFRCILKGVAYRGGGNNYYHKTAKRDNHNPLPPDGLQNLADEGFSAAVYLYSKNWDTAPESVKSEETGNTMHYYNNTLPNRKSEKELLALVYDIIKNPEKGPIYLHCWNGWHQSGYAAAICLMQFAGYSNEEAVKYWRENADGGTKGYDHIIKKIRNFKTFPEFEISDEERRLITLPAEKK